MANAQGDPDVLDLHKLLKPPRNINGYSLIKSLGAERKEKPLHFDFLARDPAYV